LVDTLSDKLVHVLPLRMEREREREEREGGKARKRERGEAGAQDTIMMTSACAEGKGLDKLQGQSLDKLQANPQGKAQEQGDPQQGDENPLRATVGGGGGGDERSLREHERSLREQRYSQSIMTLVRRQMKDAKEDEGRGKEGAISPATRRLLQGLLSRKRSGGTGADADAYLRNRAKICTFWLKGEGLTRLCPDLCHKCPDQCYKCPDLCHKCPDQFHKCHNTRLLTCVTRRLLTCRSADAWLT
jgi:hypothetical protein